MIDYTLEVNIKERSAKMLFPFITSTGMDSYTLAEQFSGNDKFVVRTGKDKAEVFLWWDFGSQIPDNVWGGLGLADVISSIDSDYAESICKQSVFEYVKAKLLEIVHREIQTMAKNFVSKNSR